MKFKILFFILSAVALSSCVDIPDFSDTPTIYYNGIDQYTETDSSSGRLQETEVVVITIDFEDGDGDLGITREQLQDSSITKRYLRVPNWNLEANYELITMKKQKDGTFTESILTGDQFKFFYDLKPDGKPGPIKGKLDLYVRFLKSTSAVPTTLKFKVRIIDRAFHISNQISEPTDEVVVPVLQ